MAERGEGRAREEKGQFFGPRGRGREARMPEACSRCGREVGLPYEPDDWVMRLDPAAPGGVIALCPDCQAAAAR